MKYRIAIDGRLIEDEFNTRQEAQVFFNELAKNLLTSNYPFKSLDIFEED